MTHRSQNRLKERFNRKQMLVLRLLAECPEKTDKAICEEANVSQRTLWRWKQDPIFIDELVDRARRALKNKLPVVYQKLTSEAQKGQHNHMRILLSHMEKLEELRANAASNQITFSWDIEEEEND